MVYINFVESAKCSEIGAFKKEQEMKMKQCDEEEDVTVLSTATATPVSSSSRARRSHTWEGKEKSGRDAAQLDRSSTIEARVTPYEPPENTWSVKDVIIDYEYVKPWWRRTGWHTTILQTMEVRPLCTFHYEKYFLLQDGRVAINSLLAPLRDPEGRTMTTKPRGGMAYFISGLMVLPENKLPLEVVETAALAQLER